MAVDDWAGGENDWVDDDWTQNSKDMFSPPPTKGSSFIFFTCLAWGNDSAKSIFIVLRDWRKINIGN